MIRFHDEEEGGGEPVRGLPQSLPEGESLLWQGRPSTLAFAIHAFHVRFVLAYFFIATAWRVAYLDSSGASSTEMLRVILNSGIGAAAGIGLLFLIAWAMAQATVYTITSRRIVLRFGVAIRKYVNLPFDQIRSADLRTYGKGRGDIALVLTQGGGIGYLKLWPHVRPLRFIRPQPMLRSLKDVHAAAGILASAIAAHAPGRVTLATAPATGPGVPAIPGLAAGAT